jgi:molybdenum cofactor synthesis domain-containing protein
MKCVPAREAAGLVIAHDITEIVPGGVRRTAFKRGHTVRPEDVEHLLRLGKENLYIEDGADDGVHEDEAARRLAAAFAGPGLEYGEPTEGRINFRAARPGLFVVDRELLDRVNAVPDVVSATRHSLQVVGAGDLLAGTRVVPLTVPEDAVQAVEECCRQSASSLLAVLPFKKYRVAAVVTGREVYEGRVADGFIPVLKKKFHSWGSQVFRERIVPDEKELTAGAVREALEQGADMVCVTGGMSVDPDDRTPAALREVCSEIVVRGVPVFPGTMFMLGYAEGVPVLGLPGCVMYRRGCVFDIIVPRLLAGLRVTAGDARSFAHGGLCLECPECVYPACSFGKY